MTGLRLKIKKTKMFKIIPARIDFNFAEKVMKDWGG